MSKINTRVRIVIVTAVVSAVYFLTQNVDVGNLFGFNLDLNLNFDPIRHLLLGLITYVGTYWALFFKIKGERFLTILLFPALGVMAGSFFTELLMNYVFPTGFGQVTLQVLMTIIVAMFTYITILTVNILNAHYLGGIPLGQAAKAAYFVISLMIAYILYFILIGNSIPIVYRVILTFLITFQIVYMCLWSIDYEVKERLFVSIAIGLVIFWGTFLLSAWPVDPTYLSVIQTLVMYFSLNMAMEIREKLPRWMWLEYGFLFAFIVVVLLVLGEWGINGGLI